MISSRKNLEATAGLEEGMRKISEMFRSIEQERLIESGKLVFAIIGIGETIANLAAMPLVLVLLGVPLVSGTWYATYRITERI